jgi:hypothetical protein
LEIGGCRNVAFNKKGNIAVVIGFGGKFAVLEFGIKK